MKRLEYISRSLSKIQHKKFELYVISRIIHKLDNPEIKYVFQQYATRDNNTGKYALIDLYLPQLGIAIEVDESHHKEQYTEDEIRQKEIEQLDIQVERVQCYEKSLEEVNNEIEKIIEKIITKKNELGDNFKPWNGLNGYEYYTDKGFFDVNDPTELISPTEICNCLGLENAAQRGAAWLKEDEILIWWPHENEEKKYRWHNKLSDDGLEIIEIDNKEGEQDKFYLDAIKKDTNIKRLVFYRKKNMLNDKLYRFVGVFMLDVDKTKNRHERVYKRIDDKFKLPHKYAEHEISNEINKLKMIDIKQKTLKDNLRKICADFEQATIQYQAGCKNIDDMEMRMKKLLDNNEYGDYQKQFEEKLKEMKEQKKKSPENKAEINNRIKQHKDSKLSRDNIEKQRFILNIRKIESYYKIHCRIEDFRIKCNLG